MSYLPKVWNGALALWDHWAARWRLASRPLRIHLEINDSCNLACPLCARQGAAPDGRSGTAATRNAAQNMDIRVAEALRPAFRAAQYVGLTGCGEPFLHPRLFDFLDIIIAEGAVPCVISNFTLIGPEIAERLVGRRMILQPSIDGGTKAVFETARRPASFDLVRQNLLGLQSAKMRRGSPLPLVHFIVTLSKLNEDDLPNIVVLAREAGAGAMTVQTCLPYNDEARAQMIEDLGRAERAVERAREAATSAGMQVIFNPLSFSLETRQALSPTSETTNRAPTAATRNPALQAGRFYCPNIWNQLHVEPDGEARVCCMSPLTLGNVLEHPVMDIWNQARIAGRRKNLLAGQIPEECAQCAMLQPWTDSGPVRDARAAFFQTLKHPGGKRS